MTLEKTFEYREFNQYLKKVFNLSNIITTELSAATPVENINGSPINFRYPHYKATSYRAVTVRAFYEKEGDPTEVTFTILKNSLESKLKILPTSMFNIDFDEEKNKMVPFTFGEPLEHDAFIQKAIDKIPEVEYKKLEQYLEKIHRAIEKIAFNFYSKYTKELDSFNIKNLKLTSQFNEVSFTLGEDTTIYTKRLDDLIKELTDRELLLLKLPNEQLPKISNYIVRNGKIYTFTNTGLLLEEKELYDREDNTFEGEIDFDSDFDSDFDFEFDNIQIDYHLAEGFIE